MPQLPGNGHYREKRGVSVFGETWQLITTERCGYQWRLVSGVVVGTEKCQKYLNVDNSQSYPLNIIYSAVVG